MSIVALLSADSIMVNATAQREQANNVRAKFSSSEGDHMTLLNIFRAFRTAKQNRVCGDGQLNCGRFRTLITFCFVKHAELVFREFRQLPQFAVRRRSQETVS